MKNKEEILSNREYDVHYYGGGRQDILTAMDEYGEERSIDFVNWVSNNQFTQYDGEWTSTKLHYSGCGYTTPELYSHYLKISNP